jgi:hypothetical protein
MHMNDYAGILTDLREREALYRAFFSGDVGGADLAGAPRMLRSALASGAREALWRALLAQIGSDDAEDSGAFAEFARSTHPAITRSALWHELDRRRAGRRPLIPSGLIRAMYRIKWAVKWRVWRWRGL